MPLFGKTNPTISWIANSESDLSGYKIYIGTSPGVYTSNVSVAAAVTSRVMSNLTPIQRWYYFAVTAFDTSGNESPFSDEVRFYISDPYTREAVAKTIARRG